MNTQDRIIGQSVLHGKHPDILFKKGITGKTIKIENSIAAINFLII